MLKLLLKHIRYRLRTKPRLPYFPTARRLNMNLIAQELIKVEPMPLPKGLLFYMDFQFPKEQDAAEATTEPATKANEKL